MEVFLALILIICHLIGNVVNIECRRLHDNENPLIVRVLLGPNESVAKVFIFNKNKDEISSEVSHQMIQLYNLN